MSFPPSASRCAPACAQFRRFLRFVGDSALHAKFLAARHLPDQVLGLIQLLNDYLVLNLSILMHFDNILRQFEG